MQYFGQQKSFYFICFMQYYCNSNKIFIYNIPCSYLLRSNSLLNSSFSSASFDPQIYVKNMNSKDILNISLIKYAKQVTILILKIIVIISPPKPLLLHPCGNTQLLEAQTHKETFLEL